MRTVLFAFSLTPILGFFLALRLPDSHASR
jgi:hypothetical protein